MLKQSKKNLLITLSFLLLAALYTWLVSGNSFFWDTIQLASKQAHWFYDNNFKSFLLPDNIDSGHPPVFGAYLALVWKVFGKTLAVSHWAMYPFLAGIIIQTQKLLKKFIEPRFLLPGMILFLADPTLLSQAGLVSPDIALVFFFLMAVNAIMELKKWMLVPAVLGLSLISMRGMMVTMGLFFFLVYYHLNRRLILRNIKKQLRLLLFYILATLPALGFLYWHYKMVDWIGFHPTSSWSPLFEPANPLDVFKNIGLTIWRFIDFGRVYIWLFLFCIFIYMRTYRMRLDDKRKKIRTLFFMVFMFLMPTFIFYSNLSMHRYLLPLILIISLLAIYSLFRHVSIKYRYTVFYLLLAGLLSGNFWKYSEGVATGWDATMGHMPYYNLRVKMVSFMKNANIPVEKTGSAFPNISQFCYTDLVPDSSSFAEKDLSIQPYILYSNIFNDFTDAEILKLKHEWSVLYRIEKRGIYLVLYKRKQLKQFKEGKGT